MHMADALISVPVGFTMWAVSAGTIAYCSKKVRREQDDTKAPLMGVLGAFLFAAQMINFTIPATGSSGHIGGGLLLSILLGPYAAFLTIASVLVVQALFFADGGLLALGCNIFNMGFLTAFVAYPLIYKKIVGKHPTPSRITLGAIVGGVIGLQLGAFSVVLETVFSGISLLPFSTFVLFMQPIHLGIGFVEGFIIAAIVAFVYKARPEILLNVRQAKPFGTLPLSNIIITFCALAFITGGFVSWYASTKPDGLEWAIRKVTGKDKLEASGEGVYGAFASIQEKLTVLPDYNFKKPAVKKQNLPVGASMAGSTRGEGGKLGTSVAGIVGGIITLGLTLVIGVIVRKLPAIS